MCIVNVVVSVNLVYNIFSCCHRILLFSDAVTIDFNHNEAAIFKGRKQGRIYLTTHRIIFNTKNLAKNEAFKSFSVPFLTLSDVKLEQPTFGANYIKGRISAQENGGFVGEVSFKVQFQSGGAIDFGQSLLQAAQMARNNSKGLTPPPYEVPMGNWYQAPPPAYSPNGQSYGWLPQNSTLANSPDPNTVFMTNNPPPYPGIISGDYPAQAFQQQVGPHIPEQNFQQITGAHPIQQQLYPGYYQESGATPSLNPQQNGYLPGRSNGNYQPEAAGFNSQPPAYALTEQKKAQ